MQHVFRLTIAAVAAIALMHVSGVATAQTVKQIKLTEKHIQGLLAAHKDVVAVIDKAQAASSEKPDPKTQAELESLAKQHGFANYGEYDIVLTNVYMIMESIEPLTMQFTDPAERLQKELEEAKNMNLPPNEKKQMLEDLTEQLKMAQPIQFPENIELVKKHYDKIDAILQ